MLREAQLDSGIDPALVYDRTLYIMASLLVVGLICNRLVKPVCNSLHMAAEELALERLSLRDNRVSTDAQTATRGKFGVLACLAWLAVGIPFLIALYIAAKAAALF